MDEIESILYVAREICVYKIPPLKANEGHRAQEWGDLSQPLWKGRMRIVEKSNTVSLLFEDSQTVFANAPYDPSRPSVEAVLDSSRYFVVRIEDDGRKAYIGIGFLERSESFDFNVALQDYTKQWKSRMNPSLQSMEQGSPSPHIPPGPKRDYSLKEGETFTITIPGRVGMINVGSGSTSSGSMTGCSFPLLPPPPTSNASKKH
ncbi:adaptin ear-binding coat-associated protein 1 NECAP-1 [Lactifluus volemus]|nr:adaptin ear-binding coat-associated protein 1 NECAP-1 [Lactifluus volemus]